ncbi:unnamed protein product [Ectocarpus sp. 13 AM-2016]
MHALATRLGGSRQRLHCLTRRITDNQPGNPLRAVAVPSTAAAVSRRCASSSSDDREREIAAELSRAPTPKPPPLGDPKQRRAATEILVNRSGLMPTRMTHEKDDRPPLTGLAKELEQMIVLNGPMTVPEYMIYALQHPKYGYYMRPKDKIGRGGDFITAPEISQTFGEMIGIWCVASWKEMGSPEEFRLVELGPGKGTLMADILRTVSSFPDFRKALSLHMVETSGDLRALQVKALGATFAPTASYSASRGGGGGGGAKEVEGSPMQLPGGGEAVWHDNIEQVPKGQPTLFIAQEFLDALPVHQFQYTENGWRERLVDVNVPGARGASVDGPEGGGGSQEGDGSAAEDGGGEPRKQHAKEADFRFVLSGQETTAVQTFLTKPKKAQDAKMVIGGLGGRTPSSRRGGGGASSSSTKKGPLGESVGDRLEVSGESILLVKEVAERIAQDRGGALFVDYGEAHALGDSLRCFKGHEEVPVLSDPGEADMTADVNFGLLRRVVAGVEGARPHGPVGQGQFLREMGIGARLTALAEQPHVTEEQADAMLEGYVRLVDPAQMGVRYKVLGISEESQEMPPPGFMSEVDPDLRK